MNAVTARQPHSNNVLDRGIPVWIHLDKLARNERRTVDQIASLEMTTSLIDLKVDFNNYLPTHQNNRRTIEPLCLCLSNLRCRNEHHPLRALTLQYADLRINGMLDVFQQFLIAATKYGGIYHLRLVVVDFLPIQCIVEFCRYNNNLKGLNINRVSFSDGTAEMSLPPNRPQDSSVMFALDKLFLNEVSFENSRAVTAFADFIARMTVQAMELGKVWASDDDVLQMTKRILSEIKIPSVKRLLLNGYCRIEHFKAALEAGTTSLIDLHVNIDHDKKDYTERLELLANFIRRAVQLNSLTFHAWGFRGRPAPAPSQIFRAIEACATVTRIQDDGQLHFSWDEVQQLQAISARNEELAGFVASPSTYPTDRLLGLMRQFDSCPTGRYMLARHLPAVLSFEKIESPDSLTTEPNSKKRKIS